MLNNSHIHPDAKIGQNVSIGPFSCIFENVEIGDNTVIHPRVTIMPGCRIGKNCQVHAGAVVGGDPQDLKFQGEYSEAIIGDNTVIRECVTINRGTEASGKTIIGSNCLLMAYVHVGHDCIVNDHVILVNSVQLAGHIEIGKHALVGGASAIHQFVNVGDHVMISGGSMILKDIPPFITAARHPLQFDGINSRGLRRRRFTNEKINYIQSIYRIIFQSGLNNTMALKKVQAEVEPSEEKDCIVSFFEKSFTSGRGIIKGYKSVRLRT